MSEPVTEPGTEQAPEPNAIPNLQGLTGLRGILCMSVVVAHTVGHLAPDSTAPLHIGLLAQAVVIFFTLSGFLIFLPFCRAIIAGEPLPSLGRYVNRRITRVFPAYVVIFLIANFAFSAVFTKNVLNVSQPRDDVGTGRITNPLDLLLNLSLLQNLVPSKLQTGLNVSWSLTTELGFYLIVPFIAVAMAALVRRSTLSPWAAITSLLALMALVGLATTTLIAYKDATSSRNLEDLVFGPHPIGVLAESTVAMAAVFATGMAAALVYVRIGQGGLASWNGKRLQRWGWATIVVFGLGALVALAAQSAYANAFLAVAAGALLVLVTEPNARNRPSPLGRLLDGGPLHYLGDISLSVYLWHFPVLMLVTRWDWYGPDSLPGAAWSVLLVSGISVALSALTYRFVEHPAMSFRRIRA